MEVESLPCVRLGAFVNGVALEHLSKFALSLATSLGTNYAAGLHASFCFVSFPGRSADYMTVESVIEVDDQLYRLHISECGKHMSASARNLLLQESTAFVLLFNVSDKATFDALENVFQVCSLLHFFFLLLCS
jgi:hypothetical protein